jgi:hypothetical protein
VAKWSSQGQGDVDHRDSSNMSAPVPHGRFSVPLVLHPTLHRCFPSFFTVCVCVCVCVCVWSFDTGSQYVAQVSLNLMIFLPQTLSAEITDVHHTTSFHRCYVELPPVQRKNRSHNKSIQKDKMRFV